MKFNQKLLQKRNILEFCKKNQLYILAFMMPFITMLALFAINHIYPFGDRSFLNIDMYHQYFPFLTEFYHKIKNGESLLLPPFQKNIYKSAGCSLFGFFII